MAGADTAVGLLAASIWRLTHLAVGTFGGCQMAVDWWDKWLLGRLAVGTFGGRQMAVGTFGGQGRSLEGAKWLLGHLAVGTYGGWDKWRSANSLKCIKVWAKWLLGHLAVRPDS